MEALGFVALVVLVAVVGGAIGLAVAPRLTEWDDRRARAGDDAGAEDAGQAGAPMGRGEAVTDDHGDAAGDDGTGGDGD